MENKFVLASRKFGTKKDDFKGESIKRIKEVDVSEESEPSEDFDPKRWKAKMFTKDKEKDSGN